MAKPSINEQIALEVKHCQERRSRFREAANRFASKVAPIQSVREVALCGSMVTEDPYPNDIDLAIVVDSLTDLPVIARAARQISSTYHGWEVLVFRPDRRYIGRICHRKQCPTETARCDNIDCGRVPFLGNLKHFSFNAAFFSLHLLKACGPVKPRACS